MRKLSKKNSRKNSRKNYRKGGSEDKTEIIHKYLTKLYEQLKEKKLVSFWLFPDEKGMKNRITGMNDDDIENMIKKDIEKYKGRIICGIRIAPHHDEPDSLAMQNEFPIWLSGEIGVYEISDDGKLVEPRRTGLMFRWEEDDFEVTKFSTRLLEKLIRIAASKKYYCVQTFGCKISYIVKKLKEEKIKIDDVLSPLF